VSGMTSAQRHRRWFWPFATGWLIREPAEAAIPRGDRLWGDDLDGVAIQAQPRDQPRVVVLVLVVEAAHHELPRGVARRRLAAPDQRIVPAAEVRVDRGDRVDAVADQDIAPRADGAVLGLAAFEDLLDVQRPRVELRADDERPPHRHALAVLADRGERPLQ